MKIKILSFDKCIKMKGDAMVGKALPFVGNEMVTTTEPASYKTAGVKVYQVPKYPIGSIIEGVEIESGAIKAK